MVSHVGAGRRSRYSDRRAERDPAVFIAPVAWAAAGVWATTDACLLRVGLVFCVVAAGAIGLARL